MKNWDKEFSIKKELIYLNSGTHSISPLSVISAINREVSEFESNPTAQVFATWGRLWEIQKELACFFGANPTDIFLRPNVTAALNDFILGVPLPAQSEILTTNLEYGAIVNICKLRAQREGLSLREIQLPTTARGIQELTVDSLLEKTISAITPKTKLLMISHIMTSCGLVVPLKKLAEETRRRGIYLVVDGAHGPGSLPLDFRDLADVDFYGANLHKWMLGPKGSSFGWVPERHHALLEPVSGGWTTFETPLPFLAFGEGNRFATQFLSSACQNFSAYFSIPETLAFWKKYSAQNIFLYLKELQETTRTLMLELGPKWTPIHNENPQLNGPLVAFELPRPLENKGFALMKNLLEKNGLQIAAPLLAGRSVLRISPHIYNTSNDLERAMNILAQV